MKSSKLTRYCQSAEVTFVENGRQDGESGFWFLTYKGERIFVSEQEVHTRLERRKNSLFTTGLAQPGETVTSGAEKA